MEETIGLQELFLIIRKCFVLIIMLAVVMTTISGIFTNFYITPMYQISTRLVVSRSDIEHIVTNTEISGITQLGLIIYMFYHLDRFLLIHQNY